MEVGTHISTGGSGIGTGTIVLNGSVFNTLDFETIPTSGLNQLVIAMIARPEVINPTGSNGLTLDFVKGTLGGLTVQVKIKMYK